MKKPVLHDAVQFYASSSVLPHALRSTSHDSLHKVLFKQQGANVDPK